jgi:hypothetical protein
MTDTTANLALPELIAAQAQKHVTVNEALRVLDALVQLAVLDRDLTLPPEEPAEGARWIVAAGASDAWSGHDGEVAAWQDGGWSFYAPQTGWLCYVVDEGALVAWSGTAWADAIFTPSALNDVAMFGVGTGADETNPFSAKLNNALWTARATGDGGDGTLRYKMSKESADKTLSVLFQDNFSGRAEIGLTGDDNFHFKVSPDGSSWTDAIVIDKSTGSASVAALTHAATGKALSGLVFTPGGDGQVSIYRIDAARLQNPRSATLSAVSGDLLTLSSAVANQFFSHGLMAGVSWVRIWNTSKSPAQPAWVKDQPASDQLQVIDAAAIAGWTAGETIRLGEGTSNGAGIAIDISPMLQAMTGAVFRQQGLFMRVLTEGSGDQTQLACSATATSGSYVAVESSTDGTVHNGILICPTSIPSPVSNSNLLFFRETNITNASNATLGRIGISVFGVFA